jgi:hypothetical protein
VFATTAARETAKYGNLIGVPVLVVLVGLIRLTRRRRKTRRVYQPMPEAA